MQIGSYSVSKGEVLCLDQLRTHVAQAIVAEPQEHVVEIPRTKLWSSVKRAHSYGCFAV